MENKERFVYAVREVETGKLISYLTNPRRKYWDREINCHLALQEYLRHNTNIDKSKFELVKFKLVEMEE